MAGFHVSSEALDFARGCVVDFDKNTGLSKTVPTDSRLLSQMKGMFCDEAAYRALLAQGDPTVYAFHTLPVPAAPGVLSFGCSILNPGKVGD